ncbi:MAG: transporter [Candidatus Binatia bacterium]
MKGVSPYYLIAFAFNAVLQVFCPGILLNSAARDLTDVLIRGSSFTVEGNDTTIAAREFAPVFAGAFSQAVTQEFPHASVAPAFSYRYNPALTVFERSTGVPGPLFSERALTLGKGQFNVGVAYSFIDFTDFNGTDLDHIQSPALLTDVLDNEAVDRGDGFFLAPASLSLIRTGIDLKAHLVVPAMRYGITENWEVSLSIPVVHSSLRVRNDARQIVDVDPSSARFLFSRDTQGQPVFIGYRDANGLPITDLSQLRLIKSQRPATHLAQASGSATGVGDLTLRSKYRFWETEEGGAALGLSLQLPSGEERDFHGTGDTHLSTFVYLSQVFRDLVEPHLNLGVDFNADDVDRSAFLWAVGVTVRIGDRLGLVMDFLGRSEFGRLPVRIPPEGRFDSGFLTNRAPETCTAQQPCAISAKTLANPISFAFFPERVRRNNIADLSFGVRYIIGTSGSLFFGALVPLNDDGLRADFIPSGGIEFTF